MDYNVHMGKGWFSSNGSRDCYSSDTYTLLENADYAISRELFTIKVLKSAVKYITQIIEMLYMTFDVTDFVLGWGY